MTDVKLDSAALEELNSAETRTLFDTVDKLSSLGVGKFVNLPQIIVVGDQSSGKSSVLEAISGVRFPIDGGLCTRFATELVLRSARRPSVTATIHFADKTKPVHKLKVADFKQDDLDRIIKTAKEQMGVGNILGKVFSKDVLRLEIEGPDMHPLTLVDLPGIFHAATAKQSLEGRVVVMELLESYMKNPNSIILAIVSAHNQLANQAVMQEAIKHDPGKTRTLGVITKPDLLRAGSSDEKEYLQIIRGREPVHRLRLGWHVLRNLAEGEQSAGSRDFVEEQFFQSDPWSSIPAADRGVAALRAKLSRVLHDHIKTGMPKVLEDIQDHLTQRQEELSQLGISRGEPQQMRAYLIDIAVNFQRLVQNGVKGHYNDSFFGGLDGTTHKLRSELRNFARAIRHVLLVHGAAQTISDPQGQLDSRGFLAPAYLHMFLAKHNYPGLISDRKAVRRASLAAELERQAAANQGTEFPGYANMELVIQLFQKQSAPWEEFASFHLETVTDAAKVFVEDVLEHVIGPSGSNATTEAILCTVVDDFFWEKREALKGKLEELLRPLKEGYALPLDHDFHEAMAKRSDKQEETGDKSVDLRESHSEFGTERIIDTMQTFYDMSLRTFTDNLVNLAVESCLVQHLPSIFTPSLVNGMSDTELRNLAAESEDVRANRAQLTEDIRLLKEGLEQCRPYKRRAAPNRKSIRNT